MALRDYMLSEGAAALGNPFLSPQGLSQKREAQEQTQ